MKTNVLAQALVLALCALGSTQVATLPGERYCRYDLPLANDPKQVRYIIDPIQCTYKTDYLVKWGGDPRDTLLRLPVGLFAYGNNGACVVSIGGYCAESFMSNPDPYEYFDWTKDSATGVIDTTHRRPSRYIFPAALDGFGPAIFQYKNRVSVCWMVLGDSRRYKSDKNRILNCLTREDGVNKFSLSSIRPDPMPIFSSVPKPVQAPSRIRPEREFDASGRIEAPHPQALAPSFHP